MKELENVMSQLEKETKKKEQAENKIKQLRQKKSQLKRKADTKRKVEKGGVFEKFEKQITGVEENTDNDLIYAFLDYVLSDNRNREKLKELVLCQEIVQDKKRKFYYPARTSFSLDWLARYNFSNSLGDKYPQ